MGVPALFSNVVRTHPNIIKTLGGVTVCQSSKRRTASAKAKLYHNLYLDSNSIVYDCVHKMRNEAPGHTTDQTIINAVCEQIHTYIKLVKPTETVIIAFDGVAPVAKLENQRNRRYKSEFTASIMEKAGVVKQSWDTTAITPGTPFMEKLDSGLNEYFGKHYQKKSSAKQVIVSSSFQAGEGEHKIFEFIRSNQAKHQEERTVIYGLDADLIMLSINHLHYCPNLFLFRETPHFIRSLNRSLDPGELYVLDINELFAGVCDGIYGRTKHKDTNHSTNALPYDYVLLVSLLGNDYMPHNPAFSIRTGGLDVVIGAYRRFVESTRAKSAPGSLLTDGEHINWDNFRTYIRTLVAMEEDLFLRQHKHRESLAKRPFSLRKDNPRRCSNGDGNGNNNTDKEISLEDEMTQRLNAIPVYNREKEKYIDPTEPYWQERYYVALLGGKRKTVGPSVCASYLEALEWTMRYYTSGCVNWRWAYPYTYAPLFSDLLEHIPSSGSALPERQESHNTPVSPITQLSYVLPVSAQHMLPTNIRHELRDKLEDKYGTNWEFEWSYCRYFWESHAIMPHIDVDHLERLVSKCGK